MKHNEIWKWIGTAWRIDEVIETIADRILKGSWDMKNGADVKWVMRCIFGDYFVKCVVGDMSWGEQDFITYRRMEDMANLKWVDIALSKDEIVEAKRLASEEVRTLVQFMGQVSLLGYKITVGEDKQKGVLQATMYGTRKGHNADKALRTRATTLEGCLAGLYVKHVIKRDGGDWDVDAQEDDFIM